MSDTHTRPARPVGVDRTGDPLLTLDDGALTAVVEIVYHGIRLTGVLDAPIGRALIDRRHHPRPGDFVVILDSIPGRGPTADAIDRLRKGWGYLVARRNEPFYTDTQWADVADQYDGKPCPTERIFYVQYGPNPGDVCRWENAEAYAVPHDWAAADEISDDAKRFLP